MSIEKITYTDKAIGDDFTAAEATEIKTVVNNNADVVQLLEKSQDYDPTASEASFSYLNLLTDTINQAGVIKKISITMASDGIIRFIACRDLGANKFRVIKEFDLFLNVGSNIVDVNVPIDEDFIFGIKKGGAVISTKQSGASTGITLLYNSETLIQDATAWTEAANHSHNISIEVDTSYVGSLLRELTAKTIAYIGDSITDFCDSINTQDSSYYVGYDKIIAEKIVFKEVFNEGYSGFSVIDFQPKIATLPATNIYSIFFGTNDWAFKEIPLGTTADYINDAGATTFYGAYRKIIDGIYAKNSIASILIYTILPRNYSGFSSFANTPNANGNTYTDFNDAIVWIANYNALPVVRLDLESGFSPTNINDVTMDGLHPNNKGYRNIGQLSVPAIKALI